MLKFIHIADVHFDNIFATKHKEFREILRNALYESFRKAINICIEKEVHALLIAGDLFESSLISFRTERFIIKEFKRLEEHGIKVFYTIGNHDVGINKQRREIEWPKNVHIFDSDNVETLINFDDKSGIKYKISSCGHISHNESRNLIPLFPKREKGTIHIGLVHSMVTNATVIDNDCYYLPCTSADLESKNYNYWALGHIHKRQQIGDESIYYAGNPQGLKSKETGEKGVLYVEIHVDGLTNVEFVETSNLKWLDINIDISTVKSNDKLMELIITELNKNGINKETSKEYIPKISLVGSSILKQSLTKSEYINHIKEELLEELETPEIIIKTDKLFSNFNKLEIENGKHVLSEILNLLQEIETKEFAYEKFVDLEFANREISKELDLKEYIMSLMDGIDNEIINEFLEVHNEN